MDKKLYKLMNWPLIEAVTYEEEIHPYSILGPHTSGSNTLIQYFNSEASKVSLILPKGKTTEKHNLELADDMGFFAVLVPGKITSEYSLEVTLKNNETKTFKDPYAFKKSSMGEKNLTKFSAGIFYDAYKYMGSHLTSVSKTEGTSFAIWAPNAMSSKVCFESGALSGLSFPMEMAEDSGVFEIFVPGALKGDTYFYEIKTKTGEFVRKLDPYCANIKLTEDKPVNVISDDSYKFTDEKYSCGLKKLSLDNRPVSVLELKLNDIFKDKNDFNKNLENLIASVKEKGYTHIELMEILNGKQGDNFYAPNSYFAFNDIITPLELKELINGCHNENIGVILDYSPAYFSDDDAYISGYDGTNLYEHLDPRKGVNPFNGMKIFNLQRGEVTSFLISAALNLINEYHADGLSIDSVSSMLYLDYGRKNGEWISNIYGGNENLDGIEFLKHLNSIVKKNNPSTIMIAREDAAFPKITLALDEDGLGFDLKYNNGFSDDYLSYIAYDPYFRAHHHNDLTFSMIYQYSENFIEGLSHDYFNGSGSLLDKMPGEEKEKLANLRLSYSYAMLHPGKKLFNVNFNEPGFKKLIPALNKLYMSYPALYELDGSADGFEWVNCISSDKCFVSFLRKSKDVNDTLLVVCNFAGTLQNITVGSSIAGKYKEIFNSDSKEFGGSNVVNPRSKAVSELGADGREYSIEVKLAPLSLAVFKYVPFTEKEKYQIEKKKEAAIANTRALEYKEEALNYKKLFEEEKANMEEAKKRMKEAEDNMKKALLKEEEELCKAKKALLECK